MAITLPLVGGLVPHFGEDPEALAETLFEVAPTVLFTVPRYLQKFASQALVAVGNSSAVKRAVYGWAMRAGRRYARGRWDGRASALDALAYAAARAAAFRPILNKLGFDELRLVISGGAPLPPETMGLWQIWGVNVCEIYGQTEEAGAIITGQRGPFPRPGDVGTVAPGFELALADSGEILIRGEHVFEGYWGNAGGDARGARRGRLAAHRRRRRVGRRRASAACGSSTARATSSSPRAARRSRRPTSRTSCARARTSPRWRCSVTRGST